MGGRTGRRAPGDGRQGGQPGGDDDDSLHPDIGKKEMLQEKHKVFPLKKK